MYNKILYAADFDEVGVHAAQKAAKLAKENNATLYLVHAVEQIPAYAYPGLAGFAEIEASITGEAKKSLFKLAGDINVDEAHTHLVMGSTKQEVLRLAKELDIDLIVVGSHGKHGLALLLGSTANAILHGANCDVLVVRHTN